MKLRYVLILVLVVVAAQAILALFDPFSVKPGKVSEDWTLGVARDEVDCAEVKKADPVVLLVSGQSLGANSVNGETHVAEGPVYNFFRGRCFKARDPLMGAEGFGANVYTQVGQRLAREFGRTVVIAPAVVGGTTVARWAPGGDLHRRYRPILKGLAVHGLRVSHFLWHQGESDLATPGHQYIQSFLSLVSALRDMGMKAPIFVSRTSRCGAPPSAEILAAQEALPNAEADLFPGPDTETLGDDLRRDGCHMTQDGMMAFAGLWVEALRGHVE